MATIMGLGLLLATTHQVEEVFAVVKDKEAESLEDDETATTKTAETAEKINPENPKSELKKKIIMLYKKDVKTSSFRSLKDMGMEISTVYTIIPGVAATVDEDLIEYLKEDKNVEGIYEDVVVQTALSGSIPQINANQVHTAGFTGKGVKVCIVDTGVDDSHPALNTLIAEEDFVNGDSDATDDNFHGTHVAGIVASTDSVNKGVAFGSSLMAAKSLDQFGNGFVSGVISGIQWCVSNGADIISMSLGGGLFEQSCDSGAGSLSVLAQVSNQAVDQGVVVVAASGNQGSSTSILSPACGSKVIAVGAVGDDDKIAPFSNGGKQLDLVAPGINIVSLSHGGNGYRTASGTSMATPHVTGVIALMLEKNPELTPEEIRTILSDNALDLGNQDFDTIFGFGRVDAFASQEAVVAADSTQPVLTIPADMIVEATGVTTIVNIGTATAVDDVDPNPIITSDAPSEFPVGDTIVTWTATDATGNSASDTQKITIQDTTAPKLSELEDIVLDTTNPNGLPVSFPEPTATDEVGVVKGPSCEPPSDTTFQLGDTIVTCTAEDARGNVGQTTFVVTVRLGQLEVQQDSFLRRVASNANEGHNPNMIVSAAGKNRALVSFDMSKITDAESISEATLSLFIVHNSNNWGKGGRSIDAHKLEVQWEEGDGSNKKPRNLKNSDFKQFKNKGDGLGVTWKCSIDSEIHNHKTDCKPRWNGGAFEKKSTDAVTIFKNFKGNKNFPETIKTVGWIEFDVTNDVQKCLVNDEQQCGWLIKKTKERKSGRLDFASKEGALAIYDLMFAESVSPKLNLKYE